MKKFFGLVTDFQGNVVPNSTITVLNYPSLTSASIFSDNGVTPKSNPFTATELDGRYDFYAANGRYRVNIDPPAGANLGASRIVDLLLFDYADVDPEDQSDQWRNGPAPSYLSPVSFRVDGDQTAVLHIGRRVRTTNTAGTVYSIIVDSQFTTFTTVTVVNDVGSLDSGLSALEISVLTAIDNAIPGGRRTGIISWSKGADLASAATLTPGNDGNYFQVTGSVPITAIASKGVGTSIILECTGSPTFTHNATSLILPGGSNIAAQPGDVLVFVESSDGNWKCVSYQPNATYKNIVQVVRKDDGEVATGITTIPNDDTIPTSSEGVQLINQAITPKNANNILEIEAVIHISHTAANSWLRAALFQDAGTNAIKVGATLSTTATAISQVKINHQMVAGTTSPITFRIFGGSDLAGTLTFNGQSGSRLYGGVINSYLKITERLP